MNKSIFAFLIFSLAADNQKEFFLEAQEAIKKSDYITAIKSYDQIVNPGFVVLYNKGLCFYKEKRWLDALIAFKQASSCASYSQLKHILNVMHDVVKQGGFSHQRTWRDSIAFTLCYVPIIVWQLLLIITLLFLIIAFMRYWSVLTKTFIILSVFFQTLYISSVALVKSETEAIVIADTKLYAGPADTYSILHSYHPGTFVRVAKQEKNWYKVKCNNDTGWITAEALILL